MNWKEALTKLNPFAKKEKVKPTGRPRAEGTEPHKPAMPVNEAVKALPEELLEGLKSLGNIDDYIL